jgi:hypothetical protein
LGIAERLRCGGEDEQLGVGGVLLNPPEEAALDLAGHRLTFDESEPDGEIGGIPGARQFEQREGIAMALGDDLVADVSVQRAVHVVEQQRTRIAIVKPPYCERG